MAVLLFCKQLTSCISDLTVELHGNEELYFKMLSGGYPTMYQSCQQKCRLFCWRWTQQTVRRAAMSWSYLTLFPVCKTEAYKSYIWSYKSSAEYINWFNFACILVSFGCLAKSVWSVTRLAMRQQRTVYHYQYQKLSTFLTLISSRKFGKMSRLAGISHGTLRWRAN